MPATIAVLQNGDAHVANPYTIAIVANPALESSAGSGVFLADPILLDMAAFDGAATYIYDVLFGRLPGQAEQLLADRRLGPRMRVVKVFDVLPATDANSLVTLPDAQLLEPRRDFFAPFLANYAITADVAYAVSASATNWLASAFYTTEDTARGGRPFDVDGSPFTHWNYCTIPGTVAIHSAARGMTALHEFGHAASSYSDGMVLDQYVDGGVGLNNKRGRPIPPVFGTLTGTSYNSDATRDGLHYPAGWQSYHPELSDPRVPSLMDNYKKAPGRMSEACQFDMLTRQFLYDRLGTKVSRP
jgi:hypothetical protein